MRNYLLKLWDSLFVLNWIETLALPLLLKVPLTKLDILFVL